MTDESLQELFEERAAIMEFDGGLSTEEAEARARIEVYREVKPAQGALFEDGPGIDLDSP